MFERDLVSNHYGYIRLGSGNWGGVGGEGEGDLVSNHTLRQ
jgi:hypothetical protein